MNFLSRRIDLHFVDAPETEAKHDGFFESEKIIQELRLPTDRIFRHECQSSDALKDTLSNIAGFRSDYAFPRKALPFIHISAHGIRDGLVIGDGDPVGWGALLEYLRPVAVKTDYNALLAFSSCHGFYAYRLAYLESGKPYHLAIGPTQKIDWKYLIEGFSVFYNALLVDGFELNAAVRQMNEKIALSPAKIDYTFGWEVQGFYGQIGHDDTEKIARRTKQSARLSKK